MCITLCKRITEAKNVEDSTKNGHQDSGYPRKWKDLSTSYQQNVDKLITTIHNVCRFRF